MTMVIHRAPDMAKGVAGGGGEARAKESKGGLKCFVSYPETTSLAQPRKFIDNKYRYHFLNAPSRAYLSINLKI
jgi:hypothetical protein